MSARFLQCAQLDWKTVTTCSPCWKNLVWYEKSHSSLPWKCRVYLHSTKLTSLTRHFHLPTSKLYAFHLKKVSMVVSTGKQHLPIFHLGDSGINMVRNRMQCKKFCAHWILNLAQLVCNAHKTSSQCWKRWIWYEKSLSSLQWICRAYPARLLPAWQVSYKWHKQKASSYLPAKHKPVT